MVLVWFWYGFGMVLVQAAVYEGWPRLSFPACVSATPPLELSLPLC